MTKHINLLPPQEQQQIRLKRQNAQVVRFGVLLILSLLLTIAVGFTYRWYLTANLKDLNAEIAKNETELKLLQHTLLQKQIQILNNNIHNFNTLRSQASASWAPFLQEFARLLPADIRVDNLTVSMNSRKIEVSGKAGSRDSVLELRKNLLASDYFENVNFPLSNLETARDLNWKYRFYLKSPKKP